MMTAEAWYTLRFDGLLDERWGHWFDSMRLTHNADGTTTLRGRVSDQAALYGLLARARDLGLTLLALERDASETTTAEEEQEQ
jgi:hypothetical protein